MIEKCVKEDGKIAINSKEFKKQLLEIFKGSEIGTRLENNNLSGKEALKIVAEAAAEKKKHTKEVLKNLSPSFDVKKISALQKEYPERYKEFIEILFSDKKSDEKIKLLKKLGIAPEQFKSEEEKENYIKSMQGYLQADVTERSFQSILHDDKEGGKLEAFNAYWNGGSLEVFNKAIENRDQEIQQEEKSGKQETKRDIAVTFDTTKNFTEIPADIPMINGSGDDTIFINKNGSGTVSIYSPSEKIHIKDIRITNKEEPFEDIKKAMNSIQFLKESGLNIFGNDISKIIEALNNRASRGTEDMIDITDGIGTKEGFIILENIGKLIKEPIESEIKDEQQLARIKKNFNANGGFLSKLQNTGYANNGQIDIRKITEQIKKGISN